MNNESNLNGMKFICHLYFTSTLNGSHQLCIIGSSSWCGRRYAIDRTGGLPRRMAAVLWLLYRRQRRQWCRRQRRWNVIRTLGWFGAKVSAVWRTLKCRTFIGRFTASPLFSSATVQTRSRLAVGWRQCTTFSRDTVQISGWFDVGWHQLNNIVRALWILCRSNVVPCGRTQSNYTDSWISHFQQINNLVVFKKCDADAVNLQSQESSISQQIYLFGNMVIIQFGTLYQRTSLTILTACFYLVLNAALKRTFTNFHSRPSRKRCPRLRFVFKLTHGVSPAAWLIDRLIE